jgi:hypothetical protein
VRVFWLDGGLQFVPETDEEIGLLTALESGCRSGITLRAAPTPSLRREQVLDRLVGELDPAAGPGRLASQREDDKSVT